MNTVKSMMHLEQLVKVAGDEAMVKVMRMRHDSPSQKKALTKVLAKHGIVDASARFEFTGGEGYDLVFGDFQQWVVYVDSEGHEPDACDRCTEIESREQGE